MSGVAMGSEIVMEVSLGGVTGGIVRDSLLAMKAWLLGLLSQEALEWPDQSPRCFWGYLLPLVS